MNFFVESLLLGILLQRLLVGLHRDPMGNAGQLNAHIRAAGIHLRCSVIAFGDHPEKTGRRLEALVEFRC